MRKLVLIMLVAASLLHLPIQAVAADSELGISLQVLKGGEGSSANINKTNRLWFVIPPGESDKRQVLINSASDITQKIRLSIAGRSQVNGELRYDPSAVSVVSQWAEFSINDFLLEPGQSRQVTISINVPLGAAVEVLQPALLVNSVDPTEIVSTNKIPAAMQISQGIFLGVGTDEDFVTSFVIDDVFGETTDLGKILRVRISNTGETPIALEGELQLSSATFFGSTIGPLFFYTPTINPGESGFGEIIVGENVPEDRYRILVRASQGFITETRNFEKNIDFPNLIQWYNFLIWGLVILLSLIVAVFSIRFLRNNASTKPRVKHIRTPPVRQLPTPPVRQLPTPPVRQLPKPPVRQALRLRIGQALRLLADKVQTPSFEQPPAPSFEKVQTPPVEQLPTPTVEKVQTPPVVQPPTPSAEQLPAPSFEKVPTPSVGQVLKLRIGKVIKLLEGRIPKPRAKQAPKPRLDQLPKPRVEQVPKSFTEIAPRPSIGQVPRPSIGQVPRQNVRNSSPKVTNQPKSQQPKKRRQFKNLAILFVIYVFKEGKKKLFPN